MLWSELLRDDPVRCEIELVEQAGATLDNLVHDGEDDPDLAPILKRLESKEARQRAALRWYGDLGHRQPEQRQRRIVAYFGPGAIVYSDPTPDWPGGRIPPCEDGLKAQETTHAPARRGSKGEWRSGKSVELAVRQLRPFEKETGRNKAVKNAHLSKRAIDTIIVHMKDGRLAQADAEGWLVIDGEMRATPDLIRLTDLATA